MIQVHWWMQKRCLVNWGYRMKYSIKLRRSIEKQLARYPRRDQERIVSAIRSLAENPRPEGSVHLREMLYRIRVGRFRIIYAVFDEQLVVVVVKTARRSEATYKELTSLLERAQRILER